MKKLHTITLLILFALIGCGKSALKTKGNTLSASNTLPTATNTASGNNSQQTQTQTQANDLLLHQTTCSNFNVLTTVSNASPRVSENVAILLKLQPCSNGIFTYLFEEGTQASAFTDSVSLSKSFTTVGNNILRFYVSVKNGAGLLIQRKEIALEFNVQAAIVTPTAPEVTLTRLPVFVNAANQPIAVKVSVNGAFTALTLNGAPIQADVQYPINPVSAGSDTYTANVIAYNGVLQRSLTQTFVLPRCNHTVANSSNVGATLNTNTSYTNTTQLWVNGESIAVPQGTNGVVLSRTLAYNPGSYTSGATVKNAFGDSFSCTTSFRQLHNPITLVLGNPVISNPTSGYSTSGNNRALHGGGHKLQFAEWQFQAATFSEDIHTGTVHAALNACPSNEVMVGLAPESSSLPWRNVLCAPLKAGLETYDVRTEYVPWQVNSIGSCGTGQNGQALEILVGTSWQDASTGPGPGFGTWGRLNLKCAKIRWATDL